MAQSFVNRTTGRRAWGNQSRCVVFPARARCRQDTGLRGPGAAMPRPGSGTLGLGFSGDAGRAWRPTSLEPQADSIPRHEKSKPRPRAASTVT